MEQCTHIKIKENIKNISEEEVVAAQNMWIDALINISKTFEDKGFDEAKVLASQVLDTAYLYQDVPVLFKPTLARQPQSFRPTREGALAYFIGHSDSFKNDTGFALKGWRQGSCKNISILIHGNMAVALCYVELKDKEGKVTGLDKTWTYIKDEMGALRIAGHHSSSPVS